MRLSSGRRLVIRADAGTRMGTGHVMRCLALAQAWIDCGGEVTFITCRPSDGLLRRLRREKVGIEVLSGGCPDRADWESTRSLLKHRTDTWIVLDGYHFDEAYQQMARQASSGLMVVDDTAHLGHYHADVLLNQNLYAAHLRYSCNSNTRQLLGTRYALLRREYTAWAHWEREIPDVARRVLVTLGGSDPQNHTLEVIHSLQQVTTTELEAIIVVGDNNLHWDVLEEAIGRGRVPMRLVRAVENMPELMAWADLAVSAAGTTVWELMFMGLPCFLLAVAENQRLIAESSAAEGTAVHVDCGVERWDALLAAGVSRLAKDSERRHLLSIRGREMVDALGAERVVHALMSEDGQQ